MTKWKPYKTRIDKNAEKISKSEKKQVCSNGLKRLDSNTENLECEEHNQLNKLDYELVLDRKLQYSQMDNQEKIKEGIVEKSYSDFSRVNSYAKRTQKIFSGININPHHDISQ